MVSFSDSFWTPDFSTGIEVLFNKLNQGCVENQEFIDLFGSRMNYEEKYGQNLISLTQSSVPNKYGFDKDDGASLKNAFKGVTEEMANEGKIHLQIALDIKKIVVDPFSKWSEEHKQRIDYSDQILKNSLKVYKNKAKLVEKIQKKYFNKCRTYESLKVGLSEEQILEELSLEDELPTETETTEDYEPLVILGDVEYGKIGLKELLNKILTEIPTSLIKVPILGQYDHVSTGSAIVSWIQENLGISKIEKSEKFGQDLLNNGFIKRVNTSVGFGSGGAQFVNSGLFHYQWKPIAFETAGLAKKLNSDNDNYDGTTRTMSDYIGGLKSSFEEPTLKKTNKDVQELDEKYQIEVKKLDKIRCDLEELIVDHLTFMEKCELDRLRALKKVILDFSASISNNISAIKSFIDKILIYEESISPDKDLLFLLQNYRTGPFRPKVTLYDNYYDSFKEQIFGVDLEIRCKKDNKTVPIIISSILSYMDHIYPDLQDDEVRSKIWVVPVRLQSTHQLRRYIEETKSDGLNDEFYSKYEPEVIASVLKLYLLELPDSLISHELYYLIKSIYVQYGADSDSKERITGITNILKELDRANLSTLKALITHFERLISIFKENKDSNIAESFKIGISQEFSNCLLRPKFVNDLNFNDKFTFKFILDLLQNKSDIFKDLKHHFSTNGSLKKNNSLLNRKNSTLQTRLKQAVMTGTKKKAETPIVVEMSDDNESQQSVEPKSDISTPTIA